MTSPSLRKTGGSYDKSVASVVKYKLKIHRDIDYDRVYNGKLHREDRTMSLFRGLSIDESESEPTYSPPIVTVVAVPDKKVERIAKIPELILATLEPTNPADVVEGVIETIIHDTKAITVRDTDDDSFVKRVLVHDEYKGFMSVTYISGYKYELDFEKLNKRIQDATEELGVADQFSDWINNEIKLQANTAVNL